MGWRNSSLQEIFNPGTEFEWSGYAFATNDALEEVLEPGYFDHWSGSLKPGDLIWFGCNGYRGRVKTGQPRPVRRALLMVVRPAPTGTVVRLVQDWGGVDEAVPAAPAARTPGS